MKHAHRLNFALLIAAALCCSLSSCSDSSVSGFQWKSGDGRPQAFTQQASFPQGAEGVFTASQSSNVYTLRKPLVAKQGEMLAAKLELASEGTLVTFRYGDKSAGNLKELRFAPSRGETVFYLSVTPGERIASCGVAVDVPQTSTGDAGQANSSGSSELQLAQIQWLAMLPSFQGYEKIREGEYRLSDGFSYTPDSHNTIWSISHDYGLASGAGGKDKVPALVVKYAKTIDADITVMAGTRFHARCSSPAKSFLIPLESFSLSQESIRLRIPDSVSVEAAYVERIPTEEARSIDPGLLLSLPSIPSGDDYAYYRWDLLPEVLVFDFRDYQTQDDYLKRLAFYVEKKGFAGRLSADDEIASLHGWNAHDYRSEDLAAFFTEAKKSNFPLNEKEKALQEFLVNQKVIVRSGQGFKGSGGAIISLSQESPPYLRHTFLTHESSHALFFVDGDYRSFCISIWDAMSDKEKWFWYLYFGWMDYDTSSAYLMANEMQAYLMQQPYAAAQKYFTTTPVNRMLEHHPELTEKLDAYMTEFGETFTLHAMEVQRWLEKRYGFAPGTTYFLR